MPAKARLWFHHKLKSIVTAIPRFCPIGALAIRFGRCGRASALRDDKPKFAGACFVREPSMESDVIAATPNNIKTAQRRNKSKRRQPDSVATLAPDANYREMLPQALAATMSGISLGDQFFEAAYRAAEQAGCEMLFEIPSLFLSDPDGRAAAIRCGNADEAELFFFVFRPESQSIRVVAASEAPESVLHFTRSYAGVLTLIRADRQVVSPLLQ
jgi:hypothetical protein